MLDLIFSWHISGLWGYELADTLSSLGLVVVTLVMAAYLRKTFSSQIISTTMIKINQVENNFRKHHRKIISQISRNFTNRNNPRHVTIEYEEQALCEFLNELEGVCLFTKNRVIHPEFVFGLFQPMLEPCLTDQQIRNEFGNKKAYSSIQIISKWFKIYARNPKWFKIRHLFYWV